MTLRGKDYRREPCKAIVPSVTAEHLLIAVRPGFGMNLTATCQREQTWHGTARLPHRHRHVVRDPGGREVATITWPDQPGQQGAADA